MLGNARLKRGQRGRALLLEAYGNEHAQAQAQRLGFGQRNVALEHARCLQGLNAREAGRKAQIHAPRQFPLSLFYLLHLVLQFGRLRSMKRVFKTRTFSRWARKVVSDAALCQAAREIEHGLFEADLGGGLCKKRIALPVQGKSGSTRTLVAKKHEDAIFFLAGREKKQPGSDFSEQEVEAAKIIAAGLQAADADKLAQLVGAEILKEICNDS